MNTSFFHQVCCRLPQLLFGLLVGVSACKSDKQNPTPAPAAPGNVIFWNSQNAVTSQVAVTLNGQGSKTIDYTLSVAPACGSSRGASFDDVSVGSYTYSASSDGFVTATGTVEVKSGTCTTEQITLVAGTGGGGTGGNSAIMFWAKPNVGTVTVSMVGQTAQITGNSATAPICGDPYSALFVSLTGGTYPFTATSTNGATWSGNVTVGNLQCFSQELIYSSGGGGTGGGGTGNAMFWTDQSLGTVSITLNGATRSLSGSYTSAPSCGAPYAATFSGLAAGTYSFSASGGGRTWNSNVTVVANQCSALRLYSNSTGGGGGSTTGSLTFWTATDHRCGNIAMTVNGATQNIANYFSSSSPGCGVSGTASFTLPPGTYSYSGRCTGLTWSGTATVTAGGCMRIQLQ